MFSAMISRDGLKPHAGRAKGTAGCRQEDPPRTTLPSPEAARWFLLVTPYDRLGKWERLSCQEFRWAPDLEKENRTNAITRLYQILKSEPDNSLAGQLLQKAQQPIR